MTPAEYKFASVPELLIFDLELSARSKILWAVLERFSDGQEFVSVTRSELSAALGCGTTTLDEALAELRTDGWVSVDTSRNQDGQPNCYQVNRVRELSGDVR